MPAAVPHVLVIRRRYLGDIVLLGPVFRSLRLHWPAAQLAALVEPGYADVLALNGDVNSTLLLPTRLGAWPAFLRSVRRARFTHVLDLDNTEKTAAVARLSGAPVRVALHHGSHRVKFRLAYTHTVHDPPELHETRPITEYYLRALEPLGVPAGSHAVQLEPRPDDLAALRRFVGASGPVLLVHPGSRSPWRIWPADRFAAVCDRVQETLGAQVVLIGGPTEQALVAEIRRLARSHVFTLPETLTVPRFAALARLSRVMLCHDSGPMHVAAAVGTPVVALYGSQNAALFRPVGTGHTLLQAPLPCGAACVAAGACTPGDSYRNYCVRRLSVDEVFAAVRTHLAPR